MTELSLAWRKCTTPSDFVRRVRVFRFGDAMFGDFRQRAAHAQHWRSEADQRAEYASKSLLAAGDYEEWQRMQGWSYEVANILYSVQDTLHPRHIGDLLRYAFDDPPRGI
jgi:hypothetical protein